MSNNIQLTDQQLQEAIACFDIKIGMIAIDLFDLLDHQQQLERELFQRESHIDGILRLCHTGH